MDWKKDYPSRNIFDPYTAKGADGKNILVNKFNITNQDELEAKTSRAKLNVLRWALIKLAEAELD